MRKGFKTAGFYCTKSVRKSSNTSGFDCKMLIFYRLKLKILPGAKYVFLKFILKVTKYWTGTANILWDITLYIFKVWILELSRY